MDDDFDDSEDLEPLPLFKKRFAPPARMVPAPGITASSDFKAPCASLDLPQEKTPVPFDFDFFNFLLNQLMSFYFL